MTTLTIDAVPGAAFILRSDHPNFCSTNISCVAERPAFFTGFSPQLTITLTHEVDAEGPLIRIAVNHPMTDDGGTVGPSSSSSMGAYNANPNLQSLFMSRGETPRMNYPFLHAPPPVAPHSRLPIPQLPHSDGQMRWAESDYAGSCGELERMSSYFRSYDNSDPTALGGRPRSSHSDSFLQLPSHGQHAMPRGAGDDRHLSTPPSERFSDGGASPGSSKDYSDWELASRSGPSSPGPSADPTQESGDSKAIFVCQYEGCGKRFTRKYYRQIHEGSHQPKVKELLPCRDPGCPAQFGRQHDRMRHEVGKHGFKPNFVCSACGKFFAMESKMKSHKCEPTTMVDLRRYTDHR